jgi:hypothetical protein
MARGGLTPPSKPRRQRWLATVARVGRDKSAPRACW